MNIYARRGDKVVFTGRNGYPVENARARSILMINRVYTVKRTDVHSSSTSVYLEEVPNESFNSVMFKDYFEAPTSPYPDSTVSYSGAFDYTVPARELTVDPEPVRESITSGSGGDFGGGGASGGWDSGSSDSGSSDSSTND